MGKKKFPLIDKSPQNWEGPGVVGMAGLEASGFSGAVPWLGERGPKFRGLGLGEKPNQGLANKHWL